MKTIPVILPRRSWRRKTVSREGCIRFRIKVFAGTGMMIGLSAEAFWVNWGDGVSDSDLIHTYKSAGTYDVVISGLAINQLNLAHCWLQTIDLSGCPWLEYVDVSFNFLTELDISACPYLTGVLCERNLLRELQMGECLPWLFYLDCSINLLESLKFPRACALQYLVAHSNNLLNLNFRNCPDLCSVDIADNLLEPDVLHQLLDSLPVVEPDRQAWVMYGQNPLFWQVDEEQARGKGWHCGKETGDYG